MTWPEALAILVPALAILISSLGAWFAAQARAISGRNSTTLGEVQKTVNGQRAVMTAEIDALKDSLVAVRQHRDALTAEVAGLRSEVGGLHNVIKAHTRAGPPVPPAEPKGGA